jgi:hypothetical protein
MNERQIDEALDARLGKLARDIPPGRDLWPRISARLRDGDDITASVAPHRAVSAWWQLGAAAALVAVSSLTTYAVMSRQEAQSERVATVEFVRHELGAAQFLPAGYMQARQELSVAFDASLERLSPETRQVVEANLRDIERSLKEIGAALARDPGNATLQQLLLAASTQELQYLDEVRRLALNVPSKGV